MYDISIVFVNYYRRDDIIRAIKSLLADIKDSAYKVKIIVSDNSNNQDKIKEALNKLSNSVYYLNNKVNIGFGKANNNGFKLFPARYYFALNPDSIILPNSKTIDGIIKFMDNNPRVGIMGPKLINLDGSLQYSCYRFDLKSILVKPFRQANLDEKVKFIKKTVDRLLMKDFDHQKIRAVDWVLGAALVIRKEAGEEIGFFDDCFFMYLEDADLCWQAWKKGWLVYYVPDIIIKHEHVRGSAKTSGIIKALFKNKLSRIHLNSWIKFIFKHYKDFKYYSF